MAWYYRPMTDSRGIDWTDETPLRLKAAAERAFPGGGMTASGLRREAARGRLVVERIAGKDYTTMRSIADMRTLCRVEAGRRVSITTERGEGRDVAQARALAKLAELRGASKREQRK
jgi:hypothetical protein